MSPMPPAATPRTFDASYYLLAAVPFVVVFLIMPCELFFNQTEEWQLSLSRLSLFPMAGALGVLITWALLGSLALHWRQVARGVALSLFALGCYLLLADLYSPVQIDHLDGGVMTSDEPIKYSLLEAGIGLLLVIILVLLIRGRGVRTASVLAGLLTAIGIGYAGVVTVHLLTPEPVIAKAGADARSTSGNVYQIVLDRMQTDVFLEAVDRADARQTFRGFELFRHNVANYLTTAPSRASYMTGTFYHEGDYKDWFREIWRDQGIQKMLSDHDYRVWNYVPFRQWRDESVDVFRYLRDIYYERTGIPASDFADFITLWLLRPVPNALTEEALGPASVAGNRVLAGLNGLEGKPSMSDDQPQGLTVNKGIEVVASKHMFEQLVEDEAQRGGRGEYVYVHAIIPHIPYVLDAACTYYDPTQKEVIRKQAYLDQAVCSVRLVEDFLIKLQALDHYDDATIILHADTGAEEGFLADPPDYRSASTTLGKPDDQLLSGAHALLMIKRPGEAGPLRELDQPTQLVDLFPSVADVLDLKEAIDTPIHGRSIYDPGDDQRETRFAFDPQNIMGKNLVEVRVEEPDNLRRSPLTVIGPARDQAHWRDEVRHAE